MILSEPRRQLHYVTDLSLFDQALESLGNAPAVGLDAERASGFRYRQSAYLLQFATAEDIWLLDPVALNEHRGWSGALKEAISDTTWLLHAATQDLPNLAELEIFPSSIYDTELAARLAGLDRFGLGSLCLELLDVELAKEHSAADWSVRPLPPEMLNYAALDVDVLFELQAELDNRLSELGRAEWASQEFNQLLSFRARERGEAPWQSISGYSKLKDPISIRIMASLWLARDELARELDVAPGRLVPDRSLIAAADARPASKAELARLREFQGRASRSKLDLWWRAVERSSTLEVTTEVVRNGIPNHRNWERKFPEAHARLALLRPIVVDLAAELNIPQENLLTPDVLRRFCWQPAQDVSTGLAELGARPWQIDLLAESFRSALEGSGPESLDPA
jgi:ribonuclease D